MGQQRAALDFGYAGLDKLGWSNQKLQLGPGPPAESIPFPAPQFRILFQQPFFGNVKIGRDITVDELRGRYDQIVYAVGCESDRHLGIPGEELAGSHSATEFVGWYNGHPDHQHWKFDLSCSAVAVVGVGNVAMDVTRILSCEADHLVKSDIASDALASLRRLSSWACRTQTPSSAAAMARPLARAPSRLSSLGGSR